MKVAVLLLDRVLALARTHAIDEDGQTLSECSGTNPLDEDPPGADLVFP